MKTSAQSHCAVPASLRPGDTPRCRAHTGLTLRAQNLPQASRSGARGCVRHRNHCQRPAATPQAHSERGRVLHQTEMETGCWPHVTVKAVRDTRILHLPENSWRQPESTVTVRRPRSGECGGVGSVGGGGSGGGWGQI